MVYPYPASCLWEETHAESGEALPAGLAFGVCDSPAVYSPRHAEESVLFAVVAEQLETFLARQRERDRLVPRFVERELRSFLECGILAYGFIRVYCDACRQDRVVPFSCKGRAVCPSCGGRRMADTAAHLVDRVFPEVPVRQWVLSLPFSLRYRLAFDAPLVRDVLQIFVRTVFASIRRRAGIPASNRQARCGAVSFVQRFGDALRLNPHFHTLALDGIYIVNEKGEVVFQHVAPPSDAEVARVADRVYRRVKRLLERRGLGPQADPELADILQRDQPLLAELYGASISGRVATGPRADRRVMKVGDSVEWEDFAVPSGPRCAAVAGFSVHADVCVPAHDRMRLERLCRLCGAPSGGDRAPVRPARRQAALSPQAPMARRNHAHDFRTPGTRRKACRACASTAVPSHSILCGAPIYVESVPRKPINKGWRD
jgi:hypothetical protein